MLVTKKNTIHINLLSPLVVTLALMNRELGENHSLFRWRPVLLEPPGRRGTEEGKSFLHSLDNPSIVLWQGAAARTAGVGYTQRRAPL